MNLTLLVEGNPKIESFFKLNLVTWLGLDVVSKPSFDEAVKCIESGVTPQLIIIRAKIGKEAAASSLIRFLQDRKLFIPTIVVGPGDEVPGSFAHVPNSLQLKILIQNAARALKITAQEMMSKPVPDFYPIPLAYFREIIRPVCNVYHKNDKKIFEVLISKNAEIDKTMIGHLEMGNTNFLYVNKLDRLEFVNYLSAEILSHLKDDDVSLDEAVTLNEKSLELLSKKLSTIGMTPETVELAKKNMDSIRRNVRGHSKLSSLLARLLNNKSSYLFIHTQLLTYVSLHIVKHIEWGNEEQQDKMAFIAFFHDIALENDRQAKIKSSAELKKTDFGDSERQLVEKHAQLAAELAAKFPHAPMGADQIIRQHHGTMNGLGFSDHYGNNVSPVSIVFLVAEEFTRILMNHEGEKLDKMDLIRQLKEEFPTSRFKKVLEKLESIAI